MIANVEPAVALFRSLGDPVRLTIVSRLAQGEAKISELTVELGLAQSTVSAHVACLRDCGLVTGRIEGRKIFYSLSRPELMVMLAGAESLLEATGVAVSLCPNFGLDGGNQLKHERATDRLSGGSR
ncbi:MAG: metalloregulator ArsR/SmtB family transcription factor [Candidatus Nanopelagicaceae bacterium]|jgi:ArsR family transcriptional regulator